VFGRFASVGGAKESWTAPVYILTADFADALPADGDPMPPNGNPHPFPGQLQHNNGNMFVQPQYPEIGWDAVPFVPPKVPLGPDHNEEVQDHPEPAVEDDQESMIMNASDNSLSSNSVQHLGLPLALNNQPVPGVELNLFVGRALTVFGPAAPPLMQFTRFFEKILPAMYSGKIPLSLDVSPFTMLQGSWSLAAGQSCDQEAMQISDEILSNLDGNWPSVKPLPVARALVFTDVGTPVYHPGFPLCIQLTIP
jgi:hypothetical protein